MSRTLWPLAGLVSIAAIAAGCGSAPAGTANGASSVHEQSVKFAECMRANGVSGFPDPSASGGFTIENVVNGTSIDTNSATFEQALSACKELQPPGFMGGKVTPSQRTARLRFAQCVRENGVPDFPDPTPNGPLVDTYRIPSSNTPAGMNALHAAMNRCSGLAAAAGVTKP